MEFVTDILAGTSVSLIAKNYAQVFIDAALTDPRNWYAKVAHSFVEQCFSVVNLKFKATVEDFQHDTVYQYWKDNLSYLYVEKPIVLRALDEFFEELPRQLAVYHDILIRIKTDSELEKEFHKMTQPLSCYFHMIYIWCTVVSSMCEKTIHQPGNWGQPVARLSFSILQGLVGLLNKYRGAHPELKALCLFLTKVVHFGVFYPCTNLVIVTPMLQFFKEHYKIFFCEEFGAPHFVRTVLICEVNQGNNIMVYEFLKLMLTQFGQSQEVNERGQLYLHYLTTKLVEDDFIEIQCDEFSKSISRPLLIAGLDYLLTLQEHILSTDCFSKRFLESILHIILRINTTSVKSLAAKLYAKLALRQFEDKEVMLHMLEAFYKLHQLTRGSETYKNITDALKMFIKAFLSNGEDLMSFENILNIPNKKFVRDELALLRAQAIIALYSIQQDSALTNDRSKQQVIYMLQHLPHCIAEAQSVEIRVALYSVYNVVNMNVFKEEKEILSSLENFFMHNFVNDCSLTDSEFRTIFRNINRVADVTGNTKTFETTASLVLEEFEKIWKIIPQKKIVPGQLNMRLYTCLRRLNAIFKTYEEPMSNLRRVYNKLFNLFLGEYSRSLSLSGYGFETLAYMCVNVVKMKDQTRKEFAKSVKMARDLNILCRNQLHSTLTADRLQYTIQQYNKFMSCAIMMLHLSLGAVLTLDKETYDVLTEAYLMAIDNLQKGGDDLACDYFKETSAFFLALHMRNFYVLPSYSIFKIVAIYGSTGSCSDTVMPELKKLILLLLESRIEIYAFCLPVIYMHISHSTSTRASINSSVADHITLIDRHASPTDAWLLMSNTLVTTLLLIEESFKIKRVKPSDKDNNRLIALSYLVPLLVRLRFDEDYFQYLDGLIDKIRKKALNASERREMEDFISKMSEHKELCESKSTVVHALVENKKIKLKERLVGPAPMWYLAHSNIN